MRSHGIDVIGYDDLGGRPGFKLALEYVDQRWLLYVAHLWHRGWSVVDVSDPERPRYLRYIDGPENTWTIQVQAAGGLLVTALERIVPGWEMAGECIDEHEEGIYVWSLAGDPTAPQRVAHHRTGGAGTHRNYWSGDRYCYLAARPGGFDGAILSVVDLSEPARPREVGQWYWPEQKNPDAPDNKDAFYLHGAPYVSDGKAYLSYGCKGAVILDVTTPHSPAYLGRVDFGSLGSALGCHSFVPMPSSGYAIALSEALAEGENEAWNYAFIVDVQDPERPRVVSSMEPSCRRSEMLARGGRFGPHNVHQWQGHPALLRSDDKVYMTYFNAGLRIFDISDRYSPQETAWWIPDDPVQRIGRQPVDSLVAQVEDVIVDARGVIYCTEKNSGLHILREAV